MGDPRDHHFIPAFFLGQWATNPDKKLIEHTIKNGKLIPKPVGPRGTGYEFDLYAFPELPPESVQFLEKEFFNYLDDTAARALDIHLTGKGEWDNELVNAWSRFMLGIHLRHPDAMPELRGAAKVIWEKSGPAAQAEYEKIREPGQPEKFDELIQSRDPLIAVKARVNMIVKSFDNEIVISHLNKMHKATVDVSGAPHKFLLSDRPVCFSNLKQSSGVAFVPISPTKLFVAVNEQSTFDGIRRNKSRDLVKNVNKFVVGRARRFVWSDDRSQENFIEKNMSKEMEPTPLFPNLDRYETPTPLPAS
jgi:hypothetical protein